MSLLLLLSCVLSTWSIYVCRCQKAHDDQIIGVSEGRTCLPLEAPKHGRFECARNSTGTSSCVLICQAGFVEPLTLIPAAGRMDADQPGTYRCVGRPGAMAWEPNILYDCVEKLHPSHMNFHYSVSINEACYQYNETQLEAQRVIWETNLQRGTTIRKCNRETDEECVGKVYLTCLNATTHLDVEISFPYNEVVADRLKTIEMEMTRAMDHDRKSTFRIRLSATSPGPSGGFFTTCPKGTTLVPDFTCRGCSRGYYMDLTTITCKACPIGTYQNKNHQPTCKNCPPGAVRKRLAIKDILRCFYAKEYREVSDITDVLAAAFTAVAVGTIVLYFRGYVTHEPGHDSKEKQIFELDFSERVHKRKKLATDKRPEVGSGDTTSRSSTTRGSTGSSSSQRRSVLLRPLPLQPAVMTEAARMSLKEERLRLTLDVATMRRSLHVPKSSAKGDGGSGERQTLQSPLPPGRLSTPLLYPDKPGGRSNATSSSGKSSRAQNNRSRATGGNASGQGKG